MQWGKALNQRSCCRGKVLCNSRFVRKTLQRKYSDSERRTRFRARRFPSIPRLRGFSAIAQFEVSAGNQVLVGGGPDGNTYVIDDQTGTYNMTGTYPQATFQTALIDFGDPDHAHVFRGLELEFDNPALAGDVTITYWLDPLNVDSPGAGKNIPLRPAMGAGRFRAFSEGGATCQRLLIQIQLRSSTNAGVIRGIKLIADPVPGMLPSNQTGGN